MFSSSSLKGLRQSPSVNPKKEKPSKTSPKDRRMVLLGLFTSSPACYSFSNFLSIMPSCSPQSGMGQDCGQEKAGCPGAAWTTPEHSASWLIPAQFTSEAPLITFLSGALRGRVQNLGLEVNESGFDHNLVSPCSASSTIHHAEHLLASVGC